MSESRKPKAIVYLDQNNVFHRYKKLEYVKLLNFIKETYDVIRTTSYNAIDTTSDSQRNFITFLSNNGYRCETVDTNVNTNVDNILTTDMVRDAYKLDHKWIVLISSDGDFQYPLNMLAKDGFQIHVIGSKLNTSLELLKCADVVHYIDDIPGVIMEDTKIRN